MDNARNTDGTPYLGHDAGAAMGEKRMGHEKPTADEGPATSDIERVRRSLERIAQGPSRTPEQRAVAARVGVCTIDPDTQHALDVLETRIAEQDAIITEQGERLDAEEKARERLGKETTEVFNQLGFLLSEGITKLDASDKSFAQRLDQLEAKRVRGEGAG